MSHQKNSKEVRDTNESKRVLESLGLSVEEADAAFDDLVTHIKKDKEPTDTMRRWSKDCSKSERKAFYQGMAMMFLMDQFTEKATRNAMFV